jgi:hypothetical protein
MPPTELDVSSLLGKPWAAGECSLERGFTCGSLAYHLLTSPPPVGLGLIIPEDRRWMFGVEGEGDEERAASLRTDVADLFRIVPKAELAGDLIVHGVLAVHLSVLCWPSRRRVVTCTREAGVTVRPLGSIKPIREVLRWT